MKLAIDIGNTSIACGLFSTNHLYKRIDIGSINLFKKFLDSLDNNKINRIIISSVVPDLTKNYQSILNNKYSCPINLINYKNSQLSLKVTTPSTVGNDRLCNIYAAIKLYNAPLIIVDFGTATTFDVINSNGEFIGGAIGAGIETSANYLINNAALLSPIDLQFPKNSIGIDTKENIQSGIMFGAIDQVEGMIKRIKNETITNYDIILTGGFSKLLSSYLSTKHILDIDLTLKGMIYIDDVNC